MFRETRLSREMYQPNQNWDSEYSPYGMHQFFVTVLFKQVHTLPAAQVFRNSTFLQPGRDDKDPALRKQTGFIKCDAQLLLAISFLSAELFRKTDDNCIAVTNGLSNFIIPILPGQQPFFIQPGLNAVMYHSSVQTTNSFPVAVCVCKKYMKPSP